MTSRRNTFGLGIALSLASFSLSARALAQDAAPTEAPDAQSESAEAAPPAAPAEPPATESAPEAESEEPARAETVSVPQSEPASTAASTASGTSVEREKTVSLLGLERLPGSAYPSAQTRGLKYGSLWLTFHGQQWPYMPRIEGDGGLRIGLSGSVWNDLSYTRINADESLAGAKVNDQNRLTTQTRAVLRVTPTFSTADGWFVQGNAELVAQGDMRPDAATGVLNNTDDVWVRIGKWDLFDVTFGRFQGWEIANHYGMALDLFTLERAGAWIMSSSLPRPSDGYGLSYFWDRQNFMLGTYAVHVYPTKYLRAEILGHLGAGNGTSNPYQLDIRPSAIFDIGWLKLKAGLEYGKSTPQDSKNLARDSKNGYGFAAQFVFAPYVEFGGSFARGFQDQLDQNGEADLNTSNTVQTVGGFLNVSPGHEPLLFGFGAFLNHWEDFRLNDKGGVDTNDQILAYGAVQYTLWDQLYLKFVVANASNKVDHFNAGQYVNNALSGRFRVMFLF